MGYFSPLCLLCIFMKHDMYQNIDLIVKRDKKLFVHVKQPKYIILYL